MNTSDSPHKPNRFSSSHAGCPRSGASDLGDHELSDRLAGMYRNDGRPAIGVFQENMTSAASLHREARALKCPDDLSAPEAWNASHRVTC